MLKLLEKMELKIHLNIFTELTSAGDVACRTQGFIETTLATAENMVILLMGVERVLLLYKPFR